jgi:Leucine-rich repeat (LRR) protein
VDVFSIASHHFIFHFSFFFILLLVFVFVFVFTFIFDWNKILKLGKCKLQEVPAPVARLKQLKELQLSENVIAGAIPSFVYRLSNLESLDLSYNKIDSILGNDLHTCPGEELEEFFSVMTNLRVLILNDNLLENILK